MDDLIHAGFESATLSFEKDLTVDELVKVIAEHVTSFEEAYEAAGMLGTVWNAGSYTGDGWRVWFVKREPVLH